MGLPSVVALRYQRQRTSHTQSERTQTSDLLECSGSLRVKFKAAVRGSTSWDELQETLRSEGFELKPKGGGLIVQSLSDKGEAHKASQLGCAYSRLI
ncbi:hypothetical protein, partial [Roseovarius sp. D0-M9]|uniref:hypothetical protein n=1 Tax=Roseovarius sp. D0-M9 TaxID=3127117 RepID=UPI003061CD63